jgi:hypothetical protein
MRSEAKRLKQYLRYHRANRKRLKSPRNVNLCNSRRCDAGDSYHLYRQKKRFSEAPCCHQCVINGIIFCLP